MAILVWIEQAHGEPKNHPVASGWEVLGKARALADEMGVPLVALVMGGETVSVAQEAADYGADQVITITHPALNEYRLSLYADALRQAVEEASATVVLTSATLRGRELAAAVAFDLGAGFAPDAVDLRVEDGKLVAVRSIFSNNILTDIVFDSPLQVAAVRPRSFPMPEPGAAQAQISALDPTFDESSAPEQVLDVRSSESGEVSLTDARIIVSGGRGVATDPAKGFALVAELADALDAAVGASRAAVDAGFIPYKHQVGQTGKTVRPDLYIAAGISGAIQHLAGMGNSKVIVAINKDRSAPIFDRAQYGIVGDLFEVLPALAEEFRKRLK